MTALGASSVAGVIPRNEMTRFNRVTRSPHNPAIVALGVATTAQDYGNLAGSGNRNFARGNSA